MQDIHRLTRKEAAGNETAAMPAKKNVIRKFNQTYRLIYVWLQRAYTELI